MNNDPYALLGKIAGIGVFLFLIIYNIKRIKKQKEQREPIQKK